MLMRRDRISEPGVVADVDEQGGLGQVVQLLGAENVFVADRDRDLLADQLDRRLQRRAGLGIDVGQAHQAHPVAHERRYGKVLAERHEVALDVDGRRIRERHERILKRVRRSVAPQDAEHDRGAEFLELLPEPVELRRHLVMNRRNRGLGPDHEFAAAALECQFAVEIERRAQLLGTPLEILGHGALRERDTDHAASRFRPANVRERPRAAPEHGQRRERPGACCRGPR